MSGIESSQLSRLWAILASHPVVEQRLRGYLFRNAPRLALAALSEEGHRGLLLEINERETTSIPESLSEVGSGALSASVKAFDPDGTGPRRFIHVSCRDHDADQAFEAFCDLLEMRARNGAIGRALTDCMEEFRRLLSGAGSDSTIDEIGLVGELVALRGMVAKCPALADAWMGPSKGRHDFRRGATAVEVKTTVRSAASGRSVHISDLDQLEPPNGGRLFLHLVRLENVHNGDVSISRLCGDIGALLDSHMLNSFERVVAAMQLSDAKLRRTYSLQDVATYEVRDGFPSLTRAHLLGGLLVPGVSKVSYNLALENAAGFQVPFEVALSAMIEAK